MSKNNLVKGVSRKRAAGAVMRQRPGVNHVDEFLILSATPAAKIQGVANAVDGGAQP